MSRQINNTQLIIDTGRSWDDWFKLLDAVDGQKQSLRQLANHLFNQYHIRWPVAEQVALGYRLQAQSSSTTESQ